jgi:DNA-binding response OmpR family regulator
MTSAKSTRLRKLRQPELGAGLSYNGVMQARPHRFLLFVDDEPNIRATLPVILRRRGFDVRVAGALSEALQEVAEHQFDALLCDLNIERSGDGYSVVQAIRRANPRAVTVILTGYPGLDSAIDAIHHHVDDYIIKPADVDALIATLESRLASRQPKARILSVSYDQPLMKTRQLLLEREGYEVVSVGTYGASLDECKKGGFDVFILGHSIPPADQENLVREFRQACSAPIISLRRNPGQEMVRGANFHIEPDPEPLLKVIEEIVASRAVTKPLAD